MPYGIRASPPVFQLVPVFVFLTDIGRFHLPAPHGQIHSGKSTSGTQIRGCSLASYLI